MTSSTVLPAPAGMAAGHDESALARATLRRVSLRLLPFLFVLYVCNFLDRTNVGIAALQMNRDLHLSASVFGLGAGIFFLGYAIFEVPSNLILARVGARRWIARIMISWGLIATAMMFVRTPTQLYALRFLLGVAEAGFFPGIIYYLSQWFPAEQRARATSRFMIAIPLSAAVGSPLSGALLSLNGRLGLAGWQWLFLMEGLPSVVLGVAVFVYLTDQPEDARWLSETERTWLTTRLRRDQEESAAPHGVPPLRALKHPMVWLVSLPVFLLLTSAYSYTFWAPTIIRDTLHTSNMQTGLITGAIGCLGAVAMLIVGESSDRASERFLHAAGCAALVALGYVGTAVLPNPFARIASLALVSIGAVSFLAPFWCLPTMLLRGSAAAAGIALVNAIGNVGGFVGPYVVGRLKDATGGTAGAFIANAVIALAAAVLCLMLRRRTVFAYHK